MNILVVYASPHGSTAEIAVFIGRLLQAYNVAITVQHADDVTAIDAYDAFIIGSAVHTSMWLPSISRFMFRYAETLVTKPIFLFLVCMIATEAGGVERATKEFIWQEAIEKLNIQQENIHAFAGKINWDSIQGDETWLIKSTYQGANLANLDTADYRNWREIARWTHDLAPILGLTPAIDSTITSHNISRTQKDETITAEGVKQLAWLDNPGEVASI